MRNFLATKKLVLIVSTVLVLGLIAGATMASAGSRGANSVSKHVAQKVAPAAGVVGARFAVVEADGSLNRGRAVTSSAAIPGFPGDYEVIFNKSIVKCAFVASTGFTGFSGDPLPGYATVVGRAGTNNGVFVSTFDSSGTLTPTAFHLVVMC